MSEHYKKYADIRGNQRPCICGSLIMFRNCCMPMINALMAGEKATAENFGAHLTYREIWPKEKNSMTKIMKRLGRFDVFEALQSLSRLNSWLQREDPIAVTLKIVKDTLPQPYFWKIYFWFSKKMRKTLFSRQLLLYAGQIIASGYTANQRGIKVHGNEEEFIDILVRLSDHLNPSVVNQEHVSSDELWQDTLAEVIANAFLNQTEDFGTAIGRMHIILTDGVEAVYERYPREKKIDLQQRFTELFGLTVSEVMLLAFTIWPKYKSMPLDTLLDGDEPGKFLIGEPYYANFKGDDVKQKALYVLSLFSKNLSDFSTHIRQDLENYENKSYAFKSFYDSPLLDAGQKAFFLLDPVFLQQRMTSGLIWLLNERLTKEEGDAMLSLFGRGFDWYVTQLMGSSALHIDQFVMTEWNGQADADILYVEKNNVFIIEAKTRFLPVQAMLSADFKKIGAALNGKLFSSKKIDRGSIPQLSKRYEDIKSKGVISNNGEVILPAEKVQNIWTITVYFDTVPLDASVWAYIEKQMENKGYAQRFIDSTTILSIEEFEMLVLLREQGQEWNSIFEKKKKEGYLKWRLQMKSWLLLRGLTGNRLHPVIAEDGFKGLFADAGSILFNQPDALR